MKNRKEIIRIIAIVAALFCLQQLFLGWLDYRCFFHHGATFFEKLNQYVGNRWVVCYLVIFFISFVCIILLSMADNRSFDESERMTDAKKDCE